MDAQVYSIFTGPLICIYICMFSPEVVHFFLFFFFFFSLLCCYFSVKCIIHVLHLTMFR